MQIEFEDRGIKFFAQLAYLTFFRFFAMSPSDQTIAQFCGVTGASKEEAVYFLEASNDDISSAITLFFDNNSANRSFEPEEQYRAPIQPSISRLQEPSSTARNHMTASVRFTNRSVFGINFSEATSAFNNTVNSTPTQTRLAQLFKLPSEIIFNGTLEEARNASKSPHRLIIVTIFKSDEFACQVANRDLWNNQAVQEVVQGTFTFVLLYWDSEECLRFITNYGLSPMFSTADAEELAKCFPFIAIIDPLTGEKILEWIGRNWTVPSLLETLVDLPTALTTVKPNFESSKEYFYEKAEPSIDEENAVAIQFRLPDGKRLRRRFFKQDSCLDLYSWLEQQEGKQCKSLFNGNTLILRQADISLQSADVRNASLTVEWVNKR